MTPYVIAALIGVVAGVVAALTGVGGGILFVPALTLALGLPQVTAEGTSLLAIIPVALLATFLQRRSGEVHLRAAVLVGIGA
ncbi:MAG: TSUP family transporter, partial [Thermoleophilia bacterium]